MNVQLTIKSLDKMIIYLYLKFLTKMFKLLKIKKFKMQNLPTKKKRITLLKSPHVNKKAREQFELKKYKTIIKFQTINIKNLFKFLILNKPRFLKLILKIENKRR